MEQEKASEEFVPQARAGARRKIGLAEAAEILGQRPATLYKWAKEGKIWYIQYGPHGRMLFFQDDVEAYLEKNTKEPLTEGASPLRVN